jgi:hypothetical protein
MVALTLLTTALTGFLSQTTTTATGFFDKISLDLDQIGRAREIAFVEEAARSTYEQNGINVNVAVWNMHIPEYHKFDHILDTRLRPTGRRGGFRVIVLQGKGPLAIGGEGGTSNWQVSGNVMVQGNVAQFLSMETCQGPLGCMESAYGNLIQDYL